MKKRKQQEERSLLGAWVCDMANKLMNESAVTMAEIRSYLNKFLNDGTAED